MLMTPARVELPGQAGEVQTGIVTVYTWSSVSGELYPAHLRQQAGDGTSGLSQGPLVAEPPSFYRALLFSFSRPYPYTPSLGYQMVSTLGLKAGKLLHWPG